MSRHRTPHHQTCFFAPFPWTAFWISPSLFLFLSPMFLRSPVAVVAVSSPSSSPPFTPHQIPHYPRSTSPPPAPAISPTSSCTTDTKGTCTLFACDSWRGPTDCILKHCYCLAGYCDVLNNGICDGCQHLSVTVEGVAEQSDKSGVYSAVAAYMFSNRPVWKQESSRPNWVWYCPLFHYWVVSSDSPTSSTNCSAGIVSSPSNQTLSPLDFDINNITANHRTTTTTAITHYSSTPHSFHWTDIFRAVFKWFHHLFNRIIGNTSDTHSSSPSRTSQCATRNKKQQREPLRALQVDDDIGTAGGDGNKNNSWWKYWDGSGWVDDSDSLHIHMCCLDLA
eukprot:GHVS01053802.1.p1 GENE.GHVS01053802.1~~GHVS01053802.1.p1  ORF type:complete len:336 (+),score=52.77 GHVS01053802.1:371-1378(+)